MELATAPPAMPLSISVQLLPPSWVRQKCGFMSSSRRVLAAAYAVLVSKWPASMLKMRVHALIAGGVTLFHLAPPSVVSWMRPSPVPAQSTLTSSGEGAIAVTVPPGAGVTVGAYLPALPGTSHVWRERSPLMGVQLCPPLAVFHTRWVAKKSKLGSLGDQMMGWVRTVRGAGSDAAAAPRPPPPGVMLAFCPVTRL